jgi:hypothetical protein
VPPDSCEPILAFDTGPGNMMIDRLAWRATNGRQSYDVGGKLARRGKVNADLLAELMQHPYLRRRPPKTTGREDFGIEFADAPGHAADLARYRARGYAMKGNRIRLVTDRPMEVVEVHPPSVNSMEMAGVTVEYYPPAPAMGS